MLHGVRPGRRPLLGRPARSSSTGASTGERALRRHGRARCPGAWAVAELVREGTEVVALDVAPGRGRAELLLEEDDLRAGRVPPGRHRRAVRARPRRVVHLAALQYPYCRDDHVARARVNVVGTVNVFDAARAAGAKLAYASSIAALGHDSLYGAWKRANEDTARVLGRTASRARHPAGARLRRRPRSRCDRLDDAGRARGGARVRIVHRGSSPLDHAGDVARLFVRGACARRGCGRVRRGAAGAPRGEVVGAGDHLPARPSSRRRPRAGATLGGAEWRPLEQGVRETVEGFRALASTVHGRRRRSRVRDLARLRSDGLDVILGDLPELDVADERSVAAFVRRSRARRRVRQQRWGRRPDGAGRGLPAGGMAPRARRQPGPVPLCTRRCIPSMRGRWGRIVNVASIAGVEGNANVSGSLHASKRQ